MSKRASTQKGNQYEKEAKDILASWGWKAEGQHRKVGFIGPGKMIMMGRDVFGSDIIAKKAGAKTLWIQVGTVSNKSNKCKQIENEPWTAYADIVQVWLRHPKKKVFTILSLDILKKSWYTLRDISYNEEMRAHGRQDS